MFDQKHRRRAPLCVLPVMIVAMLTLTLSVRPLLAAEPAPADEPLPQRIDAFIAKGFAGPFAAPASDAEFLRRVYLDLAGVIPTADEARAFLADTSADKRTKLIDQLLAGPDYPRRMTELFNVMLIERRGDDDAWLDYLRRSFEANAPWDQMVRQMLDPDATDEATRAAAYFYVKRLEKYGQNPTDYPGLTRDVGRLFLGIDLQCAQCHDHLFVKDYKQSMFQGLFMVYQNVDIFSGAKFPAVQQKPLEKKQQFMSVFRKVPHETGPHVPGHDELDVPPLEKGKEWQRPPDKKNNLPGVPAFDALAKFAQQIPSADNGQFKRNIANRLWFVMMGRGLVDPLDLQHSDNPPSHPQLLAALADEFAAHKFDIKWMLRQLALTQTYQRSSLLPDGVQPPPEDRFAVAIEKRLSAEQLLWSTLRATGEQQRVAAAEKDGKNAELDDLRKRFVGALAGDRAEPEVEINPTLKSALFLSNDAKVLSLLERRDGNLVDRLSKLDDAGAVADELYLSVLTRLPTEEERLEVSQYLKKNADRRALAVNHLAWALVTSVEFFVNH